MHGKCVPARNPAGYASCIFGHTQVVEHQVGVTIGAVQLFHDCLVGYGRRSDEDASDRNHVV